jgi:uncharacterized membrane-anchored protein
MSATSRQWLMILLGLLALGPGLCSLVATPVGIGMMFDQDGLARGIGGFALMCAAAGWAFVALMVFLIWRLRRAPVTPPPPTDGPAP